MVFLKFLLILILIYYIIKLSIRFFLQNYMNNIRKQSENFKSQQESKKKKEGDVTIEYKDQKKKKKKFSKKEGEYVDYEELNE